MNVTTRTGAHIVALTACFSHSREGGNPDGRAPADAADWGRTISHSREGGNPERLRMSALLLLIAFFQIAILIGCTAPEPTSDVPTEAQAPQPISVVFVGLPGVAEEVARQWSAQRNGKLATLEITDDELFANNYAAISANDIIIYPGNLVGSLIADEVISNLPDEVWNSPEYENRSLLRHCRTTLPRFGKDRWSIPIANPLFFMLARKDVLAAMGEPLPDSWTELFELQRRLSARDDLVDDGGNPLPTAVVLPTVDGWAAQSLLTIAASRIRHRGILDSLFARRSMEPLLETEPFEQALEELKLLATGNPLFTPAEVTRKFFSGQAAIAFGWPAKSHLSDDSADQVAELYDKVLIQRVPGSEQWFDFGERVWQPADAGIDRVEVIGFASRQASLLRSASHPTEASDFLIWLGSKQTCGSIFSLGELASPTRTSHLGNSSQWTGEVFDQEAADQYSDLFLAINEEPVFLLLPRIPGSQEYLDALDKSVHRFLAGVLSAKESLHEATAEWNKITDRYGRNRQIELLRSDQGF